MISIRFFQYNILELSAHNVCRRSNSFASFSGAGNRVGWALRLITKVARPMRGYLGSRQIRRQKKTMRNGAITRASVKYGGNLSREPSTGPIMIATNTIATLALKSLKRILSTRTRFGG